MFSFSHFVLLSSREVWIFLPNLHLNDECLFANLVGNEEVSAETFLFWNRSGLYFGHFGAIRD